MCNLVGFKNETTLEEEFIFMDQNKRKDKISKMSEEEKISILNANPFSVILKSIAFMSNVRVAQGDIFGYSHVGIDKITKSIYDKFNILNDNLSKEIEQCLKDISEIATEKLSNFGIEDKDKLKVFNIELKAVPKEDIIKWVEVIEKNVCSNKINDLLPQIRNSIK